jgi:glycosyltransferase involved in cell wall biosynthesis
MSALLHDPDIDNRLPCDALLLIGHLRSGGTQRVVSTVANAWAGQGLRLALATFDNPSNDFFPLDPRVRRYRIDVVSVSRFTHLFSWMRSIAALRRLMRETGSQIVVSFITPLNMLAIAAAFGLGRYVIVCERNDPTRQFHDAIWRVLRTLLYRFADRVTANSRGALDALGRVVPHRKLAFLPNPPPFGGKQIEQVRRMSVVLSVGRLTYQKGHDVLIDAFAQIASRTVGWTVTIAGDGELKSELAARARARSIEDRVHLVGVVPDPVPLFQSAAIFVLPSRYEGMPNALVEAMTCGLPVVVTDSSPGPLELLRHGINGLVVPGDNAPAMAEAIERLIRDATLRDRLGQAARASVTRFSFAETLDIWNDICGLSAAVMRRREPAA